jgi:hypothetical protein
MGNIEAKLDTLVKVVLRARCFFDFRWVYEGTPTRPKYLEVSIRPKPPLTVDLSDRRTISVPLGWYLRLEHASTTERRNWKFIGKGQGIPWEKIDEDIRVEGLLDGKPSAESQTSLKKVASGQANSPKQIIGGNAVAFCIVNKEVDVQQPILESKFPITVRRGKVSTSKSC